MLGARLVLKQFAAVLMLLFLSAAAAPAQSTASDAEVAAEELLKSRNWRDAAEAYTELTEAEPRNGGAWFGLGQSLHELRQYDGAIEAFSWALDLGFDEQRTMLGTAQALGAKGDADGAIDWLERLADSGSTAHLLVANAAEFESFREDPRFENVLDDLRPCRSPEYRQFDFWLGEWDVASQGPDGRQRKSASRISRIQDGCVILEEYEAQSGYSGTSLSYYDAASGKWAQTWIDNQGRPLRISGGIVEGKMVLVDEPAQGSPHNRITWTPSGDGRVRQEWESSTDGGRTWSPVFYGVYSRKR